MYPKNDIQKRAKINEYISHHNESARMMTRKVIFPTMKWMFGEEGRKAAGSGGSSVVHHFSNDEQNVKLIIRDVAKRFQHKFLLANNDAHNNGNNSSYIIGGDSPTIADLLAYPEFAQIPQIMGIDYATEWPSELKPLQTWLDDMAKLPYHDGVHRTVCKIGQLYQSKL